MKLQTVRDLGSFLMVLIADRAQRIFWNGTFRQIFEHYPPPCRTGESSQNHH